MKEDTGLTKNFMLRINNMRFISTEEAFMKIKYIRQEYLTLSNEYKELYKWYFFYQLCLLKNPLKSLMWDYITGRDNYEELKKEYIVYCEKKERNYRNLTKNN